MEDNLPQPASKEFTFAGAPIDIRSLSLIDPSTYEPPAAGGNARVALGKVKTRRTRQRADGPMQQASSKFIHRTVTGTLPCLGSVKMTCLLHCCYGGHYVINILIVEAVHVSGVSRIRGVMSACRCNFCFERCGQKNVLPFFAFFAFFSVA